MNTVELKNLFTSGKYDELLMDIYLDDAKIEYQKNRYAKAIEKFEEKKDKLYYSNLGLVFCFFHIPYKKKDYYFCSQFVVEMLQLANEIKLKKNASLYMPHQLFREIKKQLCIREVVYNPL